MPLFKLANKNTLSQLFVKEGYRQRGLGSNLVREISKTTRKPIYVNSLPENISFYTKMGFKIRKYKFFRQWSSKWNLTKQLILSPDCLSHFSLNTNVNIESNQSKYFLYKADLHDIKEIVTSLGNLTSIPQDFFLPLGFSYLIPLQLPIVYVLVMEIIVYLGVVFNDVLDLPALTIISISLFAIGLLCVKPLMYYVAKKHISQLWLVK